MLPDGVDARGTKAEAAVGRPHPLVTFGSKTSFVRLVHALKGGFFMSGNSKDEKQTIFSKAYWLKAAGEMKKPRVLVFAALMIALRVALKPVGINIAADLRINTAFLINAFGAMVFGPVVAALAAAVSDTLGCILFPQGPYFFPFVFVEIAGSVIFALFLYRRKINMTRVIMSRFCIDFFVNIVLQTPIMMLYYNMMLGKYYAPIDLLRIVKNLALFPLEAVVLAVFLRVTVPPMKGLGYVNSDVTALRFTKKSVCLLVALTLLSAASVGGYYVYHYNSTSLSASYTADERTERNAALGSVVYDRHPDWSAEETVTVVESALPRFGTSEVTYSCAVYRADTAAIAERAAGGGAGMETVRGYSKTKARNDECLAFLLQATVTLDEKTGEVLSYTETGK